MLPVIVGCEVGFWVVLLAGLVTRYVLRRKRLSVVLLVAAQLATLVLLVAAVVDLRSGATANASHGLAAIYLGFTVVFGHSMVRWADQRFAHRFADGPPPVKPPRGGAPRVRYEWREFGKAALAVGVAAVFLLGGIVLVGDLGRTQALLEWLPRLGAVLLVWLVAGPLYRTARPGRPDPA